MIDPPPDFNPNDWFDDYEPEAISTDALIVIAIGLLIAIAWRALTARRRK